MQFFLSAPLELGEAARIDGASEWRIFWSVYRPLAQPMTAAFTVIAFLQNLTLGAVRRRRGPGPPSP